ncbi:MAG: hypothetical protein IPK07_17970 [Deltaproteobacteria bacterium]|nr:hypothetical protein [Deltaproteobacteria bacterium]
MYIVAIRDPVCHATDAAQALAEALGVTLLEARGRLHGEGARVVAVAQSEAKASALAAAVAARGFGPFVVSDAERKHDERETVPVDGFTFHPLSFEARTRRHGAIGLPYHAIRLLVLGLRIVRTATTEVEPHRAVSLGHALAIGGRALTRRLETETSRVEEQRTRFLRVFSLGRQPLDLAEDGLDFVALGDAMLPTRAANFLWLVRQLRDRAGNAVFDERLVTRPGQIQVLSERLPPAKYLETAVSLLARARGAR